MASYTYALIDGVMNQTAINSLYTRKEPLQIQPLYINTRFKDNYDLGPILVAALEGSSLIKEIENNWQTSSSIIYSDQYLSTIAQHLSQLITVKNELGIESIFRFADPLTTWYWLDSYDQKFYSDILGPIQQWKVTKPQINYKDQPNPQWDIFQNPQTAKQNIPINKLAEPQMNALELAYQFRLKQKLYNILNTAYPHYFDNVTDEQINRWITTQLYQSKTKGIISEQAIGMWLASCCEFGDDFITKEQGAYQTWLTENQANKQLPMEVKLQNFFSARPKTEIQSKRMEPDNE